MLQNLGSLTDVALAVSNGVRRLHASGTLEDIEKNCRRMDTLN